MKAYDLLELATRNLRESMLRNSLTTLGIAVGVASLVSMLSLGIGLQQLASKRLQSSGLFNAITVISRRDSGGPGPGGPGGRGGFGGFAPATSDSPLLDEPARIQIEHIPGVIEAYPDLRFQTEIIYDGKPHRASISAVPSSAKQQDAFAAVTGNYFSSDNAAEAILLKSYAAELLAKPEAPQTAPQDAAPQGTKPGRKAPVPEPDVKEVAKALVGKQLTIAYAQRAPAGSVPDAAASASIAGYSVVPRTRDVKIVGVIDQNPDSLRGNGGARVYLPLQFAQNLHVMQPSDLRDNVLAGNSPTYLSLTVHVKDASQVPKIQAAIQKLGFNAFSILDAARSLSQVFAIFDIFLGVFGSLALAVASIGIVNTLVMAILERRREIGIMKSIGASDSAVRTIFFAEAGAMGILGGMLGVLIGWIIGRLINFGTNLYMTNQGVPPTDIWFVPWWLVAGAIGFALFVSLVAGWYPASRASRLDPVQALRYD